MPHAMLKLAELRNKLRKLVFYVCFLIWWFEKSVQKKCIFTNKVNKCSHCAWFVDSFGGCLPRLCEMHHDAHVRCTMSVMKKSWGMHERAGDTKNNVMQFFDLWRLFCPVLVSSTQSCMKSLLYRHSDHLFAIETEDAGIQRDTQGYIRIHVYPNVSWCILVYPPVSPLISLPPSFLIYGRHLWCHEDDKVVCLL